MEKTYRISERHACWLIGVARSTRRYRAHPTLRNAQLRKRLHELAEQGPRFGSPRLHALLRREGLAVNHKRTERIYRLEGFDVETTSAPTGVPGRLWPKGGACTQERAMVTGFRQ